MYTAEHLDLITNVSDNFTNPLTRLSGLLETVGQQADQLDPIYIRTVVQDRQLRQLNRRLATGQTLNIGTATSGLGGSLLGDDDSDLFGEAAPFVGGGRSHTLSDLSGTLSDAIGDLGDQIPDGDSGSSFSVGRGGVASNVPLMLSHALAAGIPGMGGGSDGSSGGGSAIPSDPDLSDLKQTFVDARVGMTQFYDVVAAGLPLMLTFVGAIPAVIGALGGLTAAALGAAGGLAGILGLGLAGAAQREAGGEVPGFQDFQSLFDGVGEAFFESFDPLLRDLGPFIENAIDGLPSVFDELADASMVLTRLKDDARAFGTFMVDFTSGSIRELGALADAARPVFGMIASGLSNLNITRRLGGALRETLPQVAELTSLLLDALPVIFNISRGLLFVSTAIAQFVGGVIGAVRGFFQLFGVADQVDTIFGVLIGTTFIFASAIFFAANIASFLNSQLITLATTMYSSKIAGDTLTATLGNIATGMKGVTLSSLSAAGAINAAKFALKSFLISTGVGIALVGLTSAVSHFAQEWDLLGGKIDGATDSLREFKRQQRQMGGGRSSFVGRLGGDTYVDVTETTNMTFEGDASARDAEYAGFVASSNSTNTLQ